MTRIHTVEARVFLEHSMSRALHEHPEGDNPNGAPSALPLVDKWTEFLAAVEVEAVEHALKSLRLKLSKLRHLAEGQGDLGDQVAAAQSASSPPSWPRSMTRSRRPTPSPGRQLRASQPMRTPPTKARATVRSQRSSSSSPGPRLTR